MADLTLNGGNPGVTGSSGASPAAFKPILDIKKDFPVLMREWGETGEPCRSGQRK